MEEIKRLYDYFQPEHYDIYLDINRSTKTFTGKSSITGNASDSTIKLNQKYLTITHVSVNGQSKKFNFSDQSETIEITEVPLGKIKVEVEFNAKLTDTMMGIYPSYYQINGEDKQLIGTQFETTFARQAF